MRYSEVSGHSSLKAGRRGFLAASLLVTLALAACADSDADPAHATETPGEGTVPAEPLAPEPIVRPARGPATEFPANEVGEIMVLEYHRLGEPEGEFYRSREHFAQDLQTLYDAGFRPITMRQMLTGEIDIPRGTTPVVFTIDDSSTGQFHLLGDGTPDPATMVGMWSAFSEANPEWEHGATWCVLPGADHPSNFFGELPSREVERGIREDRIRRKVDYLVSRGHEICNHTLYHARLDRAGNDAQVQEWIGRGEDSIQVYLPPDYDIVTLALPLGMWPANRSLAWRGTHNGRSYEYLGVLEVTGGPNPSPFDARFDPHSVKRVIVAPGALPRALTRYEREPDKRYISDGDPSTITVPAANAERVAADRWPGLRLRVE